MKNEKVYLQKGDKQSKLQRVAFGPTSTIIRYAGEIVGSIQYAGHLWKIMLYGYVDGVQKHTAFKKYFESVNDAKAFMNGEGYISSLRRLQIIKE